MKSVGDHQPLKLFVFVSVCLLFFCCFFLYFVCLFFVFVFFWGWGWMVGGCKKIGYLVFEYYKSVLFSNFV